MHVEQRPSGPLLVKKVSQKSISTKIEKGGITSETLMQLTQKEATLIFENPNYQCFEKLLHNAILLKDLIIQSKFLLNMIELTIIEKSNPLYQHGMHLQ